MSPVSLLLSLVLGVVVGSVTAWLHQRAAWRASLRLTDQRRSTAALLGLPLRILMPAAALFPLILVSSSALLAGLVAFGVVERLAVRRRTQERPA